MQHTNITIGVAGHIDHGKTALTSALTNIETDRLVEEKKRKISIENGYAYLDIDEGQRIAMIDVPGHEKFIKKMIAGVAGVDLVLLVVAADEGVMPQTSEHLDILHLLGIEHLMIVVTKVDTVERELLPLVKEDITESLKGTAFENASYFFVDSLSNKGIDELRAAIIQFAESAEHKNSNESLRLPIDDVFTIHGHGTIVRGTVFNGNVSKECSYYLLPKQQKVRVKQLQVHHEVVDLASVGQRVAVNIHGVKQQNIKRGDVLVGSLELDQPSDRIDVVLNSLGNISHPLKQRSPISIHTGTSDVRGRIIFYDRNQLGAGAKVHAQLELEREIVVRKQDPFILRRPTPAETIGGGKIINTNAHKHRFGEETIHELELMEKGTPKEWVEQALFENKVLGFEELQGKTGLEDEPMRALLQQLQNGQVIIKLKNDSYILFSERDRIEKEMLQTLAAYHEANPMRVGMNRSEWIESTDEKHELQKEAMHHLLELDRVKDGGRVVYLEVFSPHYPKEWEKRLQNAEKALYDQGLESAAWGKLTDAEQIPVSIRDDFRKYLIVQEIAYSLDDDLIVNANRFKEGVERLKTESNEQFSLQEAKEILGLSRKFIIPFLEKCDEWGYTIREENMRRWTK